MNKHGANQQRILPKLNINKNSDEASSPESMTAFNKNTRLVPEIRQNLRSMNILRDFQYHSLEDRELGQELTLKDSGIDTASSSTILNVISTDQLKKVSINVVCLVYVFARNNRRFLTKSSFVHFLADDLLAFQ